MRASLMPKMDAFLNGLDVLVDHIDDLPCKLRLRAEAARRGVVVLMGTDLGITPIFVVELPGNGAMPTPPVPVSV